VTSRLLEGARAALLDSGVAKDAIDERWVPGAFELPLAARHLAQTGRYSALICLGCVIRGETTHHEHVGRAATDGILRVMLETRCPIGFGVLTCDTEKQALDRAGGASGNKGADAALSALEMAVLLRPDAPR
jgi:6,7-dimethyl-8-ribityllumazine synthase